MRRGARSIALVAFLIICLLLYHQRPPKAVSNSPYRLESIDWSRYAYSQYATDSAYLCNSVMVFEALHRLGSRADRILFYPEEWDTEISDSKDRDSQLLVIARDKYKVKLYPVKMLSVRRAPEKEKKKKRKGETWDYSINKFLAFSQTQYDRVLHLDSDITLLQDMDELFFLPSSPVAMPRAYWELPDRYKLTSLLLVIEPSAREFDALVQAAYSSENSTTKFDMEILNNRFSDSALILPHRQYGLLTGEFRAEEHNIYLGNSHEEWDAKAALKEAKLVHFSDWPLPKPWIMWPLNLLSKMLPKCESQAGTAQERGCENREIWKGLYDDFRWRRKVRSSDYHLNYMLREPKSNLTFLF
jgi:alpha-N-acetylglucosamine transferase